MSAVDLGVLDQMRKNILVDEGEFVNLGACSVEIRFDCPARALEDSSHMLL